MCDSNMIRDDAMLEQLRCSLCTEYLSCAPIQVLPDGTTICGNCRPSGLEKAGYRCLGYETILNKFSFPCKYQGYGCEERLLFGEVTKHNSTCEYRVIPCPVGECLWKGLIQLILKHFTNTHPHQVLEQFKFNLDVAENKEEVALIDIEGIHFIMKYKYNAVAREFYHDVRYLKWVKEGSYTIQFNSSNDNVIEGYQCRAYSYDIENPFILNKLKIDEVLPYLKEPHQIIIAIDLNFIYDLLKCKKCKNYLAIPIFESDEGHICGNCWERGMEQTTNRDLVRHVSNSLIPCRWDNCEKVKNGDKKRKHEQRCKDRIYRCIVSDCSDSFGRHQINSHMKIHHYENCEAKAKKNNGMDFWDHYNCYAIIQNEIVGLEMKTNYHLNDDLIQTMTVKTTEYTNNSRIVVCFSCRKCCKCTKFDFKLTDEFVITDYDICTSHCLSRWNLDITIE